MSVYMTILFTLLTTQMLVLTVLVLPLPLKVRKPLFATYERLYNSKEIKVVVSISWALISLLFIDSLNNTWKYKTAGTRDPSQYRSSYSFGSDYTARIFYNQRNLYIAGANLFLMVAIPTVFNIIKRLIKYEELNSIKKSHEQLTQEFEELAKELEKKEKDVTALKSQKKGLERAYDIQSDKLNSLESNDDAVADKKSD